MQKIKLTRRQRKASRSPNAMVERSLKEGKQVSIGAAEYVGCEPVYTEERVPMMPSIWRKVIPGLPFIRVQ